MTAKHGIAAAAAVSLALVATAGWWIADAVRDLVGGERTRTRP